MKGTVEDVELIDSYGNALQFTVEHAQEFEDAMTTADAFIIPRLLDKYAQQELQAAEKDAGMKAVREFISKCDTYYHDPEGLCRTPSEKQAFREMFGQEL